MKSGEGEVVQGEEGVLLGLKVTGGQEEEQHEEREQRKEEK